MFPLLSFSYKYCIIIYNYSFINMIILAHVLLVKYKPIIGHSVPYICTN